MMRGMRFFDMFLIFGGRDKSLKRKIIERIRKPVKKTSLVALMAIMGLKGAKAKKLSSSQKTNLEWMRWRRKSVA